MLTKFCNGCNITKGVSCFSKKSAAKDGLQIKCKECDSRRMKKEYHLDVQKSRQRNKESRAQRFLVNPTLREKRNTSSYAYNKRNPEKRAALAREYLRKGKEDPLFVERLQAKQRKYKETHPEIISALHSKRRASKLLAMPKFANEDTIKGLYKLAKEMTTTSGVAHHVDHIVPLRSKLVCGLHWEGNLQIITAEENLRKGNRVWPGMP